MYSKKTADELIAYFQSLYTRHAELDSQVATEQRRPLPDQFKIQKLKRLRLKAKEKMERVFSQVQKSGLLSFAKPNHSSGSPQEVLRLSNLVRRTPRFSSELKRGQMIG